MLDTLSTKFNKIPTLIFSALKKSKLYINPNCTNSDRNLSND